MKKRWSKGRRIAAAAAVVGVAGLATEGSASAEGFAASPGFFIDVSFGENWNVGVGFDLRAAFLFEPDRCVTMASQSGIGPYVQGMWLIRGSTLRISAGVHGGSQNNANGPAWDFDFGWLWQGRVDAQPGGHGLQLGFLRFDLPGEIGARFSLYNDGSAWIPEGHLILGARPSGPFGADAGFCSEGRPQREGDGLCLGRVFVRGGRFKRRASLQSAARTAVGLQWAEAARAEAASIPAFLGLARDLHAAGAPGGLIKRAVVAASDEVRHARACAKVAQRYLGRPFAVEVPGVQPPTADTSSVKSLTRLAVESWQDGCLGEGIAAARAKSRIPLATDPYMRRSLTTIAREEATHADLAWDVLAWATKTGGKPVKQAVARAVAESSEHPQTGPNMSISLKDKSQKPSRAQIVEAVRIAATDRWRADFS